VSRLTQVAQKTITISGEEYPLNTSYKNALLAWESLEAAKDGELKPLAASILAIDYMLSLDIEGLSDKEINEALQGIADYLNKYARSHDGESKDSRPPLLCLDFDSQMLFDAFLQMNVNLDEVDIAYPIFMALLRELPKDCRIHRIMYLREQRRTGKLTAEEKKEVQRIGEDVIQIKTAKQKQAAQDNISYFDELQNKRRAAKGLPPIKRQ